ncbi:MAG: DNA repair protein [Clostridium sp.]|nr:DNA repair protein [Clostridium sp.]
MEEEDNIRLLNIAYAIEAIHARLNGSSPEVERTKNNYKNTTFTKKINGKASVSGVCQKNNMQKYIESEFGKKRNVKIKDGKQIKLTLDPYNCIFDDIFGGMLADKVTITEKEYNELEEEQKDLFKKEKKLYSRNITVKRPSRLQMSSLVNVSNRPCQFDFHTCGSSTDSLPYKLETYSGILAGIANFNISSVGKFIITDVSSELRDYDIKTAKILGVKELDNKEKFERIKEVLNSLEYLSIRGNQCNHLTDTKPKVVILCDFSWGNNAFQGVINKDGINVDCLLESLEQNKKYRLSNVYIGINHLYDTEFYKNLCEVKDKLEDYEYIKVTNVHDAFEGYINELKERF